jgi:hypothetical protein
MQEPSTHAVRRIVYELVRCGTIRPDAGAAIAYAAFARVRSIGISVAQQISPNRPLDLAKKLKSKLTFRRGLREPTRRGTKLPLTCSV